MIRRIMALMLAVLLLVPVTNAMAAEEADIVDTAVAAGNFTTLVAALQKAELVDALKGEGPFTVFAPTDEAFAALLDSLGVSAEELLNRSDLADILLYHVVAGKVMSTDLVDGMEATTLNGKQLTISLDPVMVNESNVVTADIEAANGVIHVIDAVLLPPAEEQPAEEDPSEEEMVEDMVKTTAAAPVDIVDTAVAAGNFTTLAAALEKAGLVDDLKGEGPFTVFAPTDDAFAALLKSLDVTAEELLNRDDLKDILLYHVVSGKVLSSDLVDGMEATTLNGKKIKITLDPAMANDSNITTTDIETSNGVIHVLDAVLLPPADDTTEVPQTGDQSQWLWIVLASAAGAGLMIIFIRRRAMN